MSRPNNPSDLFPSQDPSGDFGRDEGMKAYKIIATEHPDWPVQSIAEMAVRIQMVIEDRFDVLDRDAAQAIIKELNSEVAIK